MLIDTKSELGRVCTHRVVKSSLDITAAVVVGREYGYQLLKVQH